MDERILVVDDEKDICEILGFNLSNEGYRVDTATSAEEALRKLTPEHALILLDVMMGGMSGYKMAEKLRHDGNRIPIIFLTAKDTENDMLTGFSVGGDDYIPKPFRMMELLSRIRALLRRTAEASARQEYHSGSLVVIPSRHLVQVNGQPVTLTLKEYDLLCLFLSEPGTVFTRSRLLDEIWGYTFDGESRTVDVHIRTLRQKLGDAGACIQTIRGIGYKWEEQTE